jgi:hypothetical protein
MQFALAQSVVTLQAWPLVFLQTPALSHVLVLGGVVVMTTFA